MLKCSRVPHSVKLCDLVGATVDSAFGSFFGGCVQTSQGLLYTLTRGRVKPAEEWPSSVSSTHPFSPHMNSLCGLMTCCLERYILRYLRVSSSPQLQSLCGYRIKVCVFACCFYLRIRHTHIEHFLFVSMVNQRV